MVKKTTSVVELKYQQHNQLSVLPSNTEQLKELKRLYLNNDKLTTLPDVDKLQELIILERSKINHITPTHYL